MTIKVSNKAAADASGTTPRNRNGEALTPGYFWESFDNYVSDLHSGAEMEAENARRLIEHETPGAVAAAVWMMLSRKFHRLPVA